MTDKRQRQTPDQMDVTTHKRAELPPAALDQLFRQARSHKAWLDGQVEEEVLRTLYELTAWGPTGNNGSPIRIVFAATGPAKAALAAGVHDGNVAKVIAAPVTAIIAYDIRFWARWPVLSPHKDLSAAFAPKPDHAQEVAYRSTLLQAGYFIMAARALGLDVGPLSGFYQDKVDEAFLAGTGWRSELLCCLGYGDEARLRPRAGRLGFDDACRIV